MVRGGRATRLLPLDRLISFISPCKNPFIFPCPGVCVAKILSSSLAANPVSRHAWSEAV
jgi:hypothetical protein